MRQGLRSCGHVTSSDGSERTLLVRSATGLGATGSHAADVHCLEDGRMGIMYQSYGRAAADKVASTVRTYRAQGYRRRRRISPTSRRRPNVSSSGLPRIMLMIRHGRSTAPSPSTAKTGRQRQEGSLPRQGPASQVETRSTKRRGRVNRILTNRDGGKKIAPARRKSAWPRYRRHADFVRVNASLRRPESFHATAPPMPRAMPRCARNWDQERLMRHPAATASQKTVDARERDWRGGRAPR